MVRQGTVLCCLLVYAQAGMADDIPVKWTIDKPVGSKLNYFIAKNKLPPGATIKVRVVETTGEIGFILDTTPTTAKEAGDTFRAKVGEEGKLYMGSLRVYPDKVEGNNLVFKNGENKLVLEVKVSDY